MSGNVGDFARYDKACKVNWNGLDGGKFVRSNLSSQLRQKSFIKLVPNRWTCQSQILADYNPFRTFFNKKLFSCEKILFLVIEKQIKRLSRISNQTFEVSLRWWYDNSYTMTIIIKTPVTITISIKTPVIITISIKTPVTITISIKTPVTLTRSIRTPVTITISIKTPVTITRSIKTPVIITISIKTLVKIKATDKLLN